MGKLLQYADYFLENGGKSLGYDEKNLPEASHIEMVLSFQIPIWEYNGMTKEEYYSK